jgi:HTH-type transcriptional regulator / antitoxin MqsA
MKVTCAVCDSEKVKKVRRKFESRYNQTPVVIEGAEMYRCESCGEEFFTAEQSRELSRQIKSRVREEAGLLSPQEIVKIRKSLGLSQTELEELFGLGEKVVTRWENGRVIQGRTADAALRLLEMEPSLLPRLRKLLVQPAQAEADPQEAETSIKLSGHRGDEILVKIHDHGWVVSKPNAVRASGVFDTQAEAIARARELAGNGVIHIQGRDGRLRARHGAHRKSAIRGKADSEERSNLES